MDPQYRRALLLFVLGVALLANPLYLYPDDVSYESVYTYEAMPTDRVPDQTHHGVDVLDCDWHPIRAQRCVVARAMARGDRVELPLWDDEPVTAELHTEYDYVETPEGYFRPNLTVQNGTVVLSLESVSRATVVRAAAEPLDGTPGYVRRAGRNGTATVGGDALVEPRRFFVRHEGRYYLVEWTDRERRPTGWGWKTPSDAAIDGMRLLAWLGGVALLFRAGEWSERGRRTATRRREAMRDERTQ